MIQLLGPTCATAASLLPLALRTLQLSQQLEALLSAFELDLFEPSEHPAAYFVAAQAARAVASSWAALATQASTAGAVGYRLARRQEATALEGLAWGAMRGALLFPPAKVQLASVLPALGLGEGAREGLERARWEQRFGWLRGEVRAEWELFEREKARIAGLGKEDVAREAEAAFGEAVEALASFGRIPFGERGGQGAGRPELPIRVSEQSCFGFGWVPRATADRWYGVLWFAVAGGVAADGGGECGGVWAAGEGGGGGRRVPDGVRGAVGPCVVWDVEGVRWLRVCGASQCIDYDAIRSLRRVGTVCCRLNTMSEVAISVL